MTKRFVYKSHYTFIWILQAFVNIGAFVVYFLIDSNVALFNYWLPVHVFLFFAMTTFYFGELRQDN
jgi:hypothetical protein